MSRSTERNYRAEIYREVARDLEIHETYACNALEDAGLPCDTFCKKFRPTVREANEGVRLPHRRWTKAETDGAWGFFWGDDSHGCRVLAICFMAAMVEAGDA